MKKLILVLAAALLYSASSLKAQLSPAYEARLQTVFDSVCNVFNIKGASAAVHVPNVGTWKGVYGISETGVPVTDNMLFGIGSNTKTFVAAAMLRLKEQGLIDLEDTIGTWIQHPQISGQITIRQLLNHTSGIYSFTEHPAFGDSIFTDMSRIWGPSDMLQFVNAPYFAPGAGWEYSNTNYTLAGIIIEQVTGSSLDTVLQNEVFTPAGFTNTILYPQQTSAAPIANIWSAAFNWSGNNLEDLVNDYSYNHNSMFSAAWAAGAIMSTAEENAIFWSRLVSGLSFGTASLNDMMQTIPLSGTVSYGLGIFRRKNFNARTVHTHGGTNLGYINENLGDSVSGVGISVLTNQDSISNNLLLNGLVKALHKVTINPPVTSVGDMPNGQLFSICPNPASGTVRITGTKEGIVHFYDLTGRMVLRHDPGMGQPIEISSLPPGTYLVRLSTPEGLMPGSAKLVVN